MTWDDKATPELLEAECRANNPFDPEAAAFKLKMPSLLIMKER
jgi:hypothetical protein